jgi:hypothetical protein
MSTRLHTWSGLAVVGLVVSVLVATLALVATPAAASAPAGAVRSSSCTVSAVAPAAPPAAPAPSPPWSSRTIVRGLDPSVIDAATDTAYAVVTNPTRSPGDGPLESIDWQTGVTRRGPTFRVAGLTLAAGDLWVFGGQTVGGISTGPVLCQVGQQSLRLIRQVSLPAVPVRGPGGFLLSVTAGPHHSVWVGYDRTLLLIDAAHGRVVRHVTLPSGDVRDLSAAPDQQVLYVSLSDPTVAGKTINAQVVEVDARNGQIVAATSASPQGGVALSLNGGQVVGLPDGVAYSARSGMAGDTVLLTKAALSTVAIPGADSGGFTAPPSDIYTWMMSASTIYGGGALWVDNGNGVLACVDPRTGVARAEAGNPVVTGNSVRFGGNSFQLLGTDAASHTLFASAENRLLAIAAPAGCWS